MLADAFLKPPRVLFVILKRSSISADFIKLVSPAIALQASRIEPPGDSCYVIIVGFGSGLKIPTVPNIVSQLVVVGRMPRQGKSH